MRPAQALRSAALALVTTACLTLGVGSTAVAQGDAPQSLALRKIMKDMGRDMEAVTGAISREDWAAIASLAPRIARHPQPPALEKARILAYLGSNAGTFRSHDERTHDAAMALEKAAASRDGRAVIAAFATVQGSCLACHDAFRASFVEHFYGTR